MLDFDDFDFPDDYLDAFAEAAFAKLLSRFKVPSHAIAVKRGWSTLVGNSAHPITAPRGGAPWSEEEERDLLVAAAGKINLTKLAKAHGRTEHAIACRLEQLGVDRTTIVASDFEPIVDFKTSSVQVSGVTSEAQARQVAQQHLLDEMRGPKPRIAKTSPESRLRTLLTIAMGFSSPAAVAALPPPDVTFLLVDDLITFDPTGLQPPGLTDKGKQLVDSLVGRSTARKSATVSWDPARQTSVLEDGRFFLVASGDVYKVGGPHQKPTLKNPPKVVQDRGQTAEAEALRLAKENPGAKFFVLQAVSVHEVPPPKPTPAYSKRV
ncbi:hypothetical protein Xoosp2_27 [Xanthomonas phage Xoo-sp2]|uniref:Uncharacterized protein n=1 Tax=Xanthomonas phage Xoo-sp2 TaxID=1852622 RepID=A0A1X9IAG1_9CAUD|nr:hypothetical protein JTY55_gp27 [Xanthomonas phage Xoo-sp2]ANT45249.1 hypothetical protein Xoosp2_27 [Xanthomonas phage Xoo-sp2]